MEIEIWVRVPAVGGNTGCGVMVARVNRLFISRLHVSCPKSGAVRKTDEGLQIKSR